MSETIYYKTITISTGSFVQIEMAIRLEIAALERHIGRTHPDTIGRNAAVRRLAELRAALVEFSA
jgi:hypothetical protein